MIVENIIKIAIKKNVELLITLFVIESLENNQKANNSFYSYFFEKYSISSIYFFSHIINFKNQVNLFDFKNIIFLNLDPFDQLREQYYKNEVEDIKNLFNQLNFFLDLSLYSLNNFFYDVELSYVFFYKNYQKSLIYQKKLLGKNNKINFLKINLIKI